MFPGEKGNPSGWIEPDQSHPQVQYAPRDGAPSGSYAPPPSYYPPSHAQYPSPSQPPQSQYSSPNLPPQARYPSPNLPPQSQYLSQDPPPEYYDPQGESKYEYDRPSQGHNLNRSVPSGPSGSSGMSGMYATYEPDHTPGPSAGSSSSQQPQDGNHGGFMMSLGSFFGPKGPPPMWQRPAPQNLPYNSFPSMCLISNSHDLTKGFPELPPPCQMNPHPFATHDVTEEDWKRFLADLKKAASLTPGQRIKSNVIPMATGMSFFGGFLMTHMIEKKMEYKNRTAAGDTIDHWNHYFFGPRRMELVLSQASQRLSGRFGAAPIGDPNQLRMANGLRHRSGSDVSGDDDSSSSDDERHHGQHNHNYNHNQGGFLSDRKTRRSARRERRAERRAMRSERRDRKARGEDKMPYELFITAL